LQNFRGIEADMAEYNVGRPDCIAAMMSCQANDSMDFPPAKENDTSSCWTRMSSSRALLAVPRLQRRLSAQQVHMTTAGEMRCRTANASQTSLHLPYVDALQRDACLQILACLSCTVKTVAYQPPSRR